MRNMLFFFHVRVGESRGTLPETEQRKLTGHKRGGEPAQHTCLVTIDDGHNKDHSHDHDNSDDDNNNNHTSHLRLPFVFNARTYGPCTYGYAGAGPIGFMNPWLSTATYHPANHPSGGPICQGKKKGNFVERSNRVRVPCAILQAVGSMSQ
jgi:hypothetical protein